MKNIKIWGLCLLGILIFSCSDVDTESSTIDKNGKPTLSFNMTRSPQDIINNTEVYLFDYDGVTPANNWQFVQKAVGVTHGTNQVSMSIEAKTWNIALATAETNISSDIISPRRGDGRAGLMWEAKPVSGELPSMPELRTAYLDAVPVIANTTNTAGPATLFRNVAWVKVVIDKTRGLDPAGTHKFELNGVPTKLSWDGKLYPSAAAPEASASPMKGTFTIGAKSGEPGLQESDTLYFVIPAHKGSDYLNSVSATDTVVPHLNFSVDLALAGTSDRYKKLNIDIPRVPRVNHILLVKLSMLTAVEVSADILDWVDVNQNADLNQTELLLDRAEVGLAYRDTLLVNTNASNFTVTKDGSATWLTVTKDGNKVLLEADINTYTDNSPRSSFITIKANNVEKKVPVTQRPDRGTISVDNKRLVFCPVTHTTRATKINTVGGDWKFITQTHKATPNMQQGINNANVTFTRAATTNPDDLGKYYGDSIIVVKNMKTLDTDTIDIVNCFIYMYDNTINANAPTGTAQSAVTVTDDVEVYGGNRTLTNFVPVENWIYGVSWNVATQKLTFTTDREEEDEPRDGTMSFAHAECPDYVVTATVHQDIIVTIPAFDFFVVKFIWDAGSDVDIMVEFSKNDLTNTGNNAFYDKIPVGWRSYTVANAPSVEQDHNAYSRYWFKYKNERLLEWGGDAQSKEGETAFFNAPVLEGDQNSPRKVRLDIYANWFNGSSGDPMTFSMTAYKGGKMVKGTAPSGDFNSYNFYNRPDDNGVPGELLYSKSFKVNVTKGSYSTYDTGGYTYVATIVYDRIKHDAKVEWHVPYTEVSTRSLNIAPSSGTNVNLKFVGYDKFGKAIYAQ